MHRDPKLLSCYEGGRAEKIRIEDLNANDAVVVLMGRTGTGRSTFIEEATGITGIVGHGLGSNTNEVSVFRLSFPGLVDSDICFVDTPGFWHTSLTDLDVLGMIADFLNKIYQREIQLSGLLYFHDVSEIPVGRPSLESFRVFERLCGNDFRRIVLVTTMWDQVTSEENGTRIEEGLKCFQWTSLIQHGSSVKRFMKTRESAFEVLIPIFDGVNEGANALLLQREMNDMGLKLEETTAVRGVYRQVDQQVSRLQELSGKFRTKFQQATLDPTTVTNSDLQQLVTEYQQVSEDLKKNLQRMKIPIGERIQKVFRGIDWGRLWPTRTNYDLQLSGNLQHSLQNPHGVHPSRGPLFNFFSPKEK